MAGLQFDKIGYNPKTKYDVISMKQSSWIQTWKTGDQLYSDMVTVICICLPILPTYTPILLNNHSAFVGNIPGVDPRYKEMFNVMLILKYSGLLFQFFFIQSDCIKPA